MGIVCVRQQGGSDCAAAALATVARHHGRPVSVQQLRDLTGTDRAGTNLLGLVAAARRLGFEAKGVKAPFAALAQLPLPAIAHVRTDEGIGHFVVLFDVGRRRLVIADPARGVERWTPDEFRRRWTGSLALLLPGAGPCEVGPAPGPMRRLARLLGGHARPLAEAALCALLVTGLGLVSSLYVQQLIDSILVHQQAGLLDLVSLGMAGLLVFRVAFGAVRQYLLAHMSRKIDLALVRDYFRHVLALPMRFFETRKVGEILSRVTDCAQIRQVISGTTLALVLDLVFVVGATALMLAYSPGLAAVALLFAPLFALSVFAHLPALRQARRRMMEQAAQLQARLVEDVTGIETVKAFAVEEDRVSGTEGAMVRLMKETFRGELLALSLGGIATFLNGAAALAILWCGGHRVLAGELTVGQLMFFSTLLGLMIGPMERLATINLQLQDAAIAADRLGEILDLPREAAGGRRSEFAALRAGIRLESVSFRYGCREEVLKDVSLEIPAGRTVAIVGESGSGKSTLCKLLAGFYAPTAGRILLDGVDARTYAPESVRHRIGWVQQDPFVFSGSIRANIALGRPDATIDEVVAAARAARLADFIESLPEQYETPVGERGTNLSGGQRQRLAIARALLLRPDVLVFDEATSHLDTGTERAIQASLDDAFAGKTVLLIAHRLSTIRCADLIVVLDRGAIVEQGTHEELLLRGGRYAGFWGEQQGYEPVAAGARRSA